MLRNNDNNWIDFPAVVYASAFLMSNYLKILKWVIILITWAIEEGYA